MRRDRCLTTVPRGLAGGSGVPPIVAALVYWLQDQSYWTMVLWSTVSVRRLTFMASLWLGSLWMERRNRGRSRLTAAG